MLTPTLRYWYQIIWGIAGACALLGTINFLTSQSELSALSAINPNTAIRIHGRIQTSPKRLKLLGSNDVLIDCPISYCGFSGISRLNGTDVMIMFSDARIVSITSGNQTIDALTLKIEDTKITRRRSIFSILVAASLLLLSIILKNKPRSNRHRTT